MILMDKHEEALIQQYGFIVTTEGSDYIVRDPQIKKSKFVSHNLYSLLLKAIDARNKLKIKVTGDSTPKTKSNVVALKTPSPEPEPVELAAAPIPAKGNKLYLIKKMLLANPKSTVEEITKALEADGLTASRSSISTARSDFLHSIRVIKDMNRWKES